MKTKISLMLLALGLACGSAYAAHADETPMPVSNDINVAAPDQPGSWSFGATAVLLQPSVADTTYFSTVSTPDANTLAVTNNSIDQSYHWWFGADVTYHFPGNGRDVTLAYEGLHGTDDSSAAGNTMLTGDNLVAANGSLDSQYDAADLTFGQKLDMGQRVSLHPFAGLRYAYISEDGTANYGIFNDEATALDASASAENKGTFSGIGPRFGSDAQVNLGQGFSIRGRLGLSALIGSASPTANAVLVPVGGTANNLDFNNSSTTRVVPEFDGRLGLNYTHDINSNMALGIEAGWQAEDYINAVAQTNMLGTVQYSDFTLQGPYARLQLDLA